MGEESHYGRPTFGVFSWNFWFLALSAAVFRGAFLVALTWGGSSPDKKDNDDKPWQPVLRSRQLRRRQGTFLEQAGGRADNPTEPVKVLYCAFSCELALMDEVDRGIVRKLNLQLFNN